MHISLSLLLNLASANDGLHLLQTHAHVHSATQPKPKEPIPANAKTPNWPLAKAPYKRFGPDGTWATPYCKDVIGCTPYCVDGCNGVAIWEASHHAPGLGAVGREAYDKSDPKAHFLTCVQGNTGGPRGRKPFADYKIKVHGGFVDCFDSENSTKPSFWSNSKMTTAEKDEKKIHWGTNDDGVTKSWNSGGAWGDGEGWGNEFCPQGCVNDCAEFKLGGFLSCGVTPEGHVSGWYAYDGARSNANGPNYRCPQNVIAGTGAQAFTWCGETKKKCKLSEDTKQKIKEAKAARKAARAALKAARAALQIAKGNLTEALDLAAAECE